MIYLFHGSDVEKVRVKAFAWVAAARAKEPNLVYARLAREELTEAALEDAALSSGLFVKRLLVLIDDPFALARATGEDEGDGEMEGARNVIEGHIDALAASENAIIILAPSAGGGSASGVKLKQLIKVAKKVYSFDKPTARESRGFNSALVNALAERSRKKLWLEVARALRAGDAPEMLHGILHWKARDLMAKGGRAWKQEEARRLSLSLIALLQDSRRKNLDLSESLERFAFSI